MENYEKLLDQAYNEFLTAWECLGNREVEILKSLQGVETEKQWWDK